MNDDEFCAWLREVAEELGASDRRWQRLRLQLAACVCGINPADVCRTKGDDGAVVAHSRGQTAERTLGEMSRVVARLQERIEARRAELARQAGTR